MFNENEMTYGYNDVSIQPAGISNIEHRSECLTKKNGYLPIFTAPMSTVINEKNYDIFDSNGIIPILPRNIDIAIRNKYMEEGKWAAYSLSEFEEIIDKYESFNVPAHILIDVANGNMKKIFELSQKAKQKFGKKNIILMAGNIANPETYFAYCKVGIDYVRCGIGGGSGCFHPETEIITKNGKKKIKDIKIGEEVLTHRNVYSIVINTIENYEEKKLIVINNEVKCTENHKFYVVDKNQKDLINDKNLQKYAYWVKANELDKEKHLLVAQ